MDNSNSSPSRIETSENQEEGGVRLMAKAFNPISPEWNLSSHPLSLSHLPPLAHPPLSLSLSFTLALPLTFCHWRFLRSRLLELS